MRILHVSALISLLLVAGCKKSTPASPAVSNLDGTYTGTFQRQTSGSSPISQVSLVFSGGEWSGTSQTPKYPGLCKGTYTVIGKKITFTNTCIWTADFDWTLILSGDYEFTATGNALEITKPGPSYTDIYRLSK
ncbi:hypothetical protein [Hymenobacter rubidus]|uniref:hypothetical protein n=1 Tax=Hymenobacter rubidus TaxID=1441626 RepID=UPI00191D6C01|nr:hypothetical protein [Hymenobacter rubidus]